jgi:Xaa-Pro aminopeptidase
MKQPVKEAGYLLKPPLGHVCGVDLMEAQVSQQNEMLLEAGMTIIIHPTVLTVDGKRSFFWGETYLVGPDGFERLHRSRDELLTI